MSDKSSTKQTLQEGAYLLMATALITKVLGAFFKIPLSSEICLGDLGFGYFSAAYDLLTPITTLALSGFPVAVSYFISYYVSLKDFSSVGQVVAISKRFLIKVTIIGFVLMGLFIYPYMRLTSSSKEYLYGLVAILPSILFCGVLSLYRGYFQGFLCMKPYATSNLIEVSLKLILGFGFAITIVQISGNVAFAAAGALFGITLGTAFSTLYIYLKYKKHSKDYKFKLLSNKKQEASQLKRSIIILSLTVAVSSLAGCIVSFIDTTTVRPLLKTLIENNTDYFKNLYSSLLQGEEIINLPTILYGIRSKAFAFFNIIISLCMAIGVSIVPNISESAQDKTETSKKINTSLRLTSLISFPSAFGFVFLGKEIMILIFGEGQSAQIGGNILVLYGIASLFAGFSIVIGNILQSRKKHLIYLIAIIIAAIIKLSFNYALGNIVVLNIYSNVISTILFFAVIFIINIFALCKCESLHSLKGVFLKPMISGFLCGISAHLISLIAPSKIYTVFAIVVAVAVYLLCLLLTKFFKYEDFESLPKGDKIIALLKKMNFLG